MKEIGIATTAILNFFNSRNSLAETQRKLLKSKNAYGDPIRLTSKTLAVIADQVGEYDTIYIAESAGIVRRIVLDVGGPLRSRDSPSFIALLVSYSMY